MIATEEMAHCSSHTYFSSGCGECSTAELFRIMYSDKLEKKRYDIHHLTIDPGRPTPHIQLMCSQLHSVLKIFLTNSKMHVIKAVKKELQNLKKAGEVESKVLKAALDAIKWDDIVIDVSSDLSGAYEAGAKEGIAQLSMKVDYNEINESALSYANKRAAEMIGKKYIDGELIENSNAKFSISDTTRDDIKDLVEKVFKEQSSFEEFELAVKTAGTFSDYRANMIARTEIAMAQVRGNLEMWKQSGIVQTVNIVLSGNHVIEDQCDEAASSGPHPISSVPLLPLHPSCMCGYLAVELREQ